MPVPTHLGDYLFYNAKKYPDKQALVTDDNSLTWAELGRLVSQATVNLANKLPNDHQEIIGLLMPNTWQLVVAYLAIVQSGHIALPIDVIFKPLEIDAVIGQIKPTFIIADKHNIGRAGSRAPVVRFDELTKKSAKKSADYFRQSAETQIASLIFTSGTTGQPKAVPYTHQNHIWNIVVCSKVWDWTEDDVQLVSARLSHMLGLVMGLSGTLYHGNTMYLQDRFNADKVLQLLASGKISMFSHGPAVFTKLTEAAKNKKYDLSKVLFICGSGPLPPSLWQQFKDIFGSEILEVYGTTETGRIASNLLHERIPGSPGRPLPDVLVKFDEHNQVMVRSPGLFPGYYKNPTATRSARTKDGFWKTGDIGEFSGGRLVLRGRLKERIRRQGYTISPRDIEWALHKDRRIREVYVMGVQQPNAADDKIVYFISGKINEPELHNFCAANLPSIWRPDSIVLLDKLPRNASGKPHLSKLRAMLT